ncbi:hypothetical protein, partial [Lactococcus fujiensis]
LSAGVILGSIGGGAFYLHQQEVNQYVTPHEQKVIAKNPKLLKMDKLPFVNKKEDQMVSFKSKVNFDKFIKSQNKFPIQLVFYKNTCPYCNAALPAVYKADDKKSAYYINVNEDENKTILLSLTGQSSTPASTIVEYKNQDTTKIFDYALKQEKPQADLSSIEKAFD